MAAIESAYKGSKSVCLGTTTGQEGVRGDNRESICEGLASIRYDDRQRGRTIPGERPGRALIEPGGDVGCRADATIAEESMAAEAVRGEGSRD